MSNSNKIADIEQHMRWISENNHTAMTWKRSGYKKHKSEGAVYDPASKFNVSWLHLRGKPKQMSVEEHREIIQREKYTTKTWPEYGYAKYKDKGAVYCPQRVFNKPWAYFSGSNTHIMSRAMPSHFFAQLNEFRKRLFSVIRHQQLIFDDISDLSDEKVEMVGWNLDNNFPREMDNICITNEGMYFFEADSEGNYIFECAPEDEKYTALTNIIDDSVIGMYKNPKIKNVVNMILESRENAKRI